MKRLLLVFATVLLLAGCATSGGSLSRLHPGMSRAEVIDLLGPPRSLSGGGATETLYYFLPASMAPQPGPWFVRLVNEKVQAFGPEVPEPATPSPGAERKSN